MFPHETNNGCSVERKFCIQKAEMEWKQRNRFERNGLVTMPTLWSLVRKTIFRRRHFSGVDCCESWLMRTGRITERREMAEENTEIQYYQYAKPWKSRINLLCILCDFCNHFDFCISLLHLLLPEFAPYSLIGYHLVRKMQNLILQNLLWSFIDFLNGHFVKWLYFICYFMDSYKWK